MRFRLGMMRRRTRFGGGWLGRRRRFMFRAVITRFCSKIDLAFRQRRQGIVAGMLLVERALQQMGCIRHAQFVGPRAKRAIPGNLVVRCAPRPR